MSQPAQDARIVGVRQLSQHVRELTLEPLQPVRFQPGQWISLRLPVGARPPLTRAYSMAEPESAHGRLVVVFDLVPDGQGSSYLWERQAGDVLSVAGPFGRFVLPQTPERELLFLARFTGIVPIRCMLKAWTASAWSAGATLIYGAPDESSRIYHQEFEALASRSPRFRYRPVIGDGHAELDQLRTVLAERQDYGPYVSGVKDFVGPIREFLAGQGFERKAIKHETYD